VEKLLEYSQVLLGPPPEHQHLLLLCNGPFWDSGFDTPSAFAPDFQVPFQVGYKIVLCSLPLTAFQPSLWHTLIYTVYTSGEKLFKQPRLPEETIPNSITLKVSK
jgi:hypothetical protein